MGGAQNEPCPLAVCSHKICFKLALHRRAFLGSLLASSLFLAVFLVTFGLREARERKAAAMTTFDLFSSVRDGNTDIVRHLLQSKNCRARLNHRNEWGDTALHLAAEAGNGEICQMLIAAGASVTVRNNRGETCLHRAAVGGHVSSVSAIVGRDQDPEAVDSQNDAGYTALHHAAKHGSKELIEILVKAGADRLIENNAGETPYMVARKFEQLEAERLLLNVEQQHADNAIKEMNRREKEVIRAYFRAVKYASHTESKARILITGDRGSGKTSLKKTMLGEPYNPQEKPSSGIIADPSITRITFRQYKEWVQQPATKDDTHRLNLEYIDSIIDYVIKFLRQPRVVKDEIVESTAFQVEKERPKSVVFDTTDSIIPDQPISDLSSSHSLSTSTERPIVPPSDQPSASPSPVLSPATSSDSSESIIKKGILKPPSDDSNRFLSNPSGSCVDQGNRGNTGIQWAIEEQQEPEPINGGTMEAQIEEEIDDDRLRRFAQLGDDISPTSPDTPNIQGRRSPIVQTNSPTRPTSINPKHQESLASKTQIESPAATMPFSFIRPKRELSRLLVEKIPMELLRRMVIRWPVGDEQFQDRSELNSNRLMMNVWDASGDPLQLNFVPFFYSDRSIFITVYDVTRGLNQVCESYQAKNLLNVDGSFPTNAEVLESWISCAVAHTKGVPSVPFKCTKQTPVLPPLIITCTNTDSADEGTAADFVKFFDRQSFHSYKKHLLEFSHPTAVRVSNRYETINTGGEDLDEENHYSGHHIMRREVDHLARQMPYICDEVPIQWVKFEQLLCGLQQQKKVILLLDDLSKYIAEHCQMSGPLRILPVLSQFHDIGTVAFFYRHPELSKIVIIRPQWLASSLGSIITSHPGNWVTAEVQSAFTKLGQCGVISKDMVSLAYRCARMGQRHWNEMLFILNCMDILCCHPSLHDINSYYLPAMVVVGAPNPFYMPSDSDPTPLHFTTGDLAVPIAVFNQLVVRCVRSCQYEPTFYYKLAHIRLNSTHHLLLWIEHTSIVCLVQSNVTQFCQSCQTKESRFEFAPDCSSISHLIGDQTDLMPSDNITRLIETSTNSGVDPTCHLSLPDEVSTLDNICPKVLSFLSKNLQFLCDCWFPGLHLHIEARTNGQHTVLNQHWMHTVLDTGDVPSNLQVWFNQ